MHASKYELSEESTSDALTQYYQRRKAGQTRWISEMKDAISSVSKSEEFQTNGSPIPIALTEVPFFDVELVGVPALGYLAKSAYTDSSSFSYLMEEKGE